MFSAGKYLLRVRKFVIMIRCALNGDFWHNKIDSLDNLMFSLSFDSTQRFEEFSIAMSKQIHALSAAFKCTLKFHRSVNLVSPSRGSVIRKSET